MTTRERVSTYFIVGGIIVLILGAVATLLDTLNFPGSSSGAVVVIGFIPISFGSGPNGGFLLVLALMTSVLLAALSLLLSRRSRIPDED